ncbi:MAG: chaperonin GroEL [Thermodesulfobacteriota bacterium]
MGHKKLLFREEARDKVLAGATLLADAVRVTLGPRSKCVLLERKWAQPLVCNDGVTIAKEVSFAEPEMDLGARMMRQVAERTGEAVGDGTSTATILAHAIFREGVRNVVAGASAIDLKRGIDRGLAVATEALRASSRAVASRKEKAQVAAISAHNDASIGELVADAVERVGTDGVVSVEEAKTTQTTLDVVEGLQLDRGFASPYFVTDPERMECVLENPLILLHDRRITTMKDLLPLLESVVKAGRSLLIIAEDVDGDALATLVVNRVRGAIACAAVKAPGFGDRRKALLEDVAIVTGGRVIAEELGRRLDNVELSDLGTAARVVIDKDSTTIIGGGGDRAAIKARTEQVRAEIAKATGEYDREKLEERVAKLSGGVAVIRVGAPSEAEMKNRKEAFEDAISATRAAIAEGIVPGGGLALLRAAIAVEAEAVRADGDERTGLGLLARALEAPARQIAENSGYDDGVVVERMRGGSGNFGFDAARGEYVDLIEAGIIDPTKVVRVGLENAVSVAGVLLLTEATVTEVPEERAEARGLGETA